MATSIKGAASSRALQSALRGAGISSDQTGMEVDNGVGGGRAGRADGRVARHGHLGPRSVGPMDQTGRHQRNKDAPYVKPSSSSAGRELLPDRPGGTSSSSSRGGPGARRTNLNPGSGPSINNLRRAPEGTRLHGTPDRDLARKQHSKLNEVLKSDGMKQWLLSRLIAPGVMNMSNLGEDTWLKEQGVPSPADPDAPHNAGWAFWKLIDMVIQIPSGTPVHTLSLANNNFRNLSQLAKLPICMPNIRALDLSNNPIHSVNELRHLQAQGEQKGKVSLGSGNLKSLIELKLTDCKFRNDMLAKPDGADEYQHAVLRRFPGLLILDGVSLNRVVFPVERKPRIRLTDDDRKTLAARPFTFPADVQSNFFEDPSIANTVNQFCAKFFSLLDENRPALLDGYAPNATISISANTLPSRSAQSLDVSRTRNTRPNPVSFEAWTKLPGRNFFRGASSVEERMATLKSPADAAELIRWWTVAVPGIKHPLTDASKWLIDSWVLDGEGPSSRLCAVIEGEFQELPSGTYRSFSRTFILSAALEGSKAALSGWPAVILSEIMIVHSYLGTGSFDDKRTLAKAGISIAPPALSAPVSAATTVAPNVSGLDPAQQAPLVNAVRQRTGMNASFSEMCLAQNGWDIERAVANFNDIRGTIPPEAFIQ